MGGLSKWEILIILAYIVIQVVSWIWLVVDMICSLIECKNCSRRKNCEFIIFSEYCDESVDIWNQNSIEAFICQKFGKEISILAPTE